MVLRVRATVYGFRDGRMEPQDIWLKQAILAVPKFGLACHAFIGAYTSFQQKLEGFCIRCVHSKTAGALVPVFVSLSGSLPHEAELPLQLLLS